MKIAEMSKNKHIWCVYMSSDGKIHMEKHPVVYLNSKYVYYKTARKDMLDWEYASSIHERLDSHCIDAILGMNRRWFWKIDDNMNNVLQDVKSAKVARDEKRAIEKIKAEYADAQRRLERAKKAYDKLPDSEKT